MAAFTLPTDGPEYNVLSAGEDGSCAIQAGTGKMLCKGYPGYPTGVATTATWAAISLGYNWGCGLLTSGELKCWNANNPNYIEYGQMAVPANLGRWAAVSAGYEHTCGILAGGTMRCWGDKTYGISDVRGGSTSKWIAVAAGYMTTCGIHPDGTMECWGSNLYGVLNMPKDVTAWSTVDVGGFHACGVTAKPVAGKVRCWGCLKFQDGQCTVPAGL
jgi:hypothetical protein